MALVMVRAMGRVSLGVALCVLVGCQFTGTSRSDRSDGGARPDAEPPADASEDIDAEVIEIEAEVFSRNSENGPGKWVLAADHPGFEGDGYLLAEGGTTCEPGECGRAEWDIAVEVPGEYRLRFRYDASSASRDTAFWDLVARDGSPDPIFSEGSPPFLHDFDHQRPDWSWDSSGQRIELGGGEYTLVLDRRAGGLEIDRIELSAAPPQ